VPKLSLLSLSAVALPEGSAAAPVLRPGLLPSLAAAVAPPGLLPSLPALLKRAGLLSDASGRHAQVATQSRSAGVRVSHSDRSVAHGCCSDCGLQQMEHYATACGSPHGKQLRMVYCTCMAAANAAAPDDRA
jgi:hypothetical protein